MPDHPRDDRRATLVVVFGFSVGLGVGTVTIPLLALAAGYDAPSIGFLTALAAAVQLGTRIGLPVLLGRFTDRALLAISASMMAATFGLLLLSTALPVFALAQVLQGASRAIFWTSSQAHAVRGTRDTTRRLVDLNVVGLVGTMVGPALGGMLAVLGLGVALVAAAVGAVLAMAVSLLLVVHPPFDRQRSAGTLGLLRRDGVDVACWASLVGGVWWSMIGSYIPVILVGAGIGSEGIGWLITASEAAGAGTLFVLRNVPPLRLRLAVTASTVLTGLTLVAVAIAPPHLLVYGALLVLGGANSGLVTSLSPALASLAARDQEQGDALSLTGTFRAVALFGAPALVGGLLSLVALGPALALVAGVSVVPGTWLGRRRRAAD